MKTAATAAIAALTLASSGAAQVRPSWSAGARLTEASVGPTDPALWFGGRLEWSAPRASFEATAAGGRGWRGRLGGELSIVSRWNHDLGGGFDARASLGGAVERPIGQETGGELWSRLGMARRIGPFVVQAGGMLLGVSRAKSVGGAGGFLSSALDLGPVTISGDVGQLATLSGSLATTTLGDGAIPGSTGIPTGDTLKAGGGTTTARRLSHALIGARIRQGRFEVYTNVLRRTPLELGESVGWEAGFAIGPVAGARLRVAAGRMPAPQTIYLPYRKQLAVGLELVGRRPTDRRDAASGDVAFDLLVGPPTLPARIVVRHPTAIRVEIAGDFSNWEPVQLVVVSPRVFETSIRLGPGAHQINVRFDGGRWEVPPGLGSAPDEFGGRAGMIVLDRE